MKLTTLTNVIKWAADWLPKQESVTPPERPSGPRLAEASSTGWTPAKMVPPFAQDERSIKSEQSCD